MAAEIKSTIIDCVFISEWKNPGGTLTYFHDLTLENGSVISIGTAEKYAEKISKGAEITYKFDKDKPKLLSSSKAPASTGSNSYSSGAKKSTSKSSSGGGGYKRNEPKKPEDFLGYVWGYAKDFIIAGKSMNDVEEMNKVARYLYSQVCDMLENGPDKVDSQKEN